MTRYTIILHMVLGFALFSTSFCQTAKDRKRLAMQGNTKVIMGATFGDTSLIRRGFGEGGDVNPILTEAVGEKLLKFGTPYVDFPVASALHCALSQGEKAHLDAAFLLMKSGASINHYVLPVFDDCGALAVATPKAPRGYPPALLYALGLGARPTPTHAAILQRLFQTMPTAFNFTMVSEWLTQTGNPPLLHIPVLAGFFDGVYMVAVEFGADINYGDSHGVSPLQAATWEGRMDMMQLLLSVGANVTGVDNSGRTVLHYAVLRGFADIISLVHYNMTLPIIARPKKGSIHTENLELENRLGKKRFCRLVEVQDNHGRTAMDIALLKPVSTLAAETLVRLVQTDCKGLSYRMPEMSSKEDSDVLLSVPSVCAQQACSFRGGWFYPKGAPKHHSSRHSNMEEHPQTVSHVDGTTLDPSAFYNDYITTQTPVVISNGASLSSQPIWAYWEREDFLARYGDRLLVRGEEQYYSYYDRLDISYWSQGHRLQTQSEEMTVAEWVARMEYTNESPIKSHSRKMDKNENKVAVSMSCCLEEDLSRSGTGVGAEAKIKYNAWNSPWMAHSVDPLSRAELITRSMRADAVAKLDEEKEYIRQKTASATVNVHFDSIVDTAESLYGPEAEDDMWKLDLEPVSLFNDICTIHRSSCVGTANGSTVADKDDLPSKCRGKSAENMASPYSIFIGPMNTSIPIQAHNSSWEILITGLKKWYLMPPGHSIYAFTHEIDTRLGNHSFESNLTQFVLSIPEWLSRHGNALIKRGLVYEVIQYPGDIVYIPHNWAYGSINLGDSVSISQEFCTFLNTDQRFYPVGNGLYGGQDRHRRYNHRLESLTSDLMASINKPKDTADTSLPQFLPV